MFAIREANIKLFVMLLGILVVVGFASVATPIPSFAQAETPYIGCIVEENGTSLTVTIFVDFGTVSGNAVQSVLIYDSNELTAMKVDPVLSEFGVNAYQDITVPGEVFTSYSRNATQGETTGMTEYAIVEFEWLNSTPTAIDFTPGDADTSQNTYASSTAGRFDLNIQPCSVGGGDTGGGDTGGGDTGGGDTVDVDTPYIGCKVSPHTDDTMATVTVFVDFGTVAGNAVQSVLAYDANELTVMKVEPVLSEFGVNAYQDITVAGEVFTSYSRNAIQGETTGMVEYATVEFEWLNQTDTEIMFTPGDADTSQNTYASSSAGRFDLNTSPCTVTVKPTSVGLLHNIGLTSSGLVLIVAALLGLAYATSRVIVCNLNLHKKNI